MKYKFLFNFNASRIGGGYKRLYEYSKYFNNKNGAYFIIHPHCSTLINEFKNRYAIKLDEDEFLYPSQTVVSDEEDSKHEIDPVPSSKLELFREKSQLCEIAFAKKFFKLFNIDKEEGEFGGDIKNDFFLCNLLGIIFLGHYINFDYIELNEDKLINENKIILK